MLPQYPVELAPVLPQYPIDPVPVLPQYSGELAGIHALMQHYPLFNHYGSVASETSSLYSGSDLMASSTEDQGVDLTGLIESAVDSDDDDDYSEQMQVHESLALIILYLSFIYIVLFYLC